jgi:hypothetical protein
MGPPDVFFLFFNNLCFPSHLLCLLSLSLPASPLPPARPPPRAGSPRRQPKGAPLLLPRRPAQRGNPGRGPAGRRTAGSQAAGFLASGAAKLARPSAEEKGRRSSGAASSQAPARRHPTPVARRWSSMAGAASACRRPQPPRRRPWIYRGVAWTASPADHLPPLSLLASVRGGASHLRARRGSAAELQARCRPAAAAAELPAMEEVARGGGAGVATTTARDLGRRRRAPCELPAEIPRPHRLARPHGLEEGGGGHGACAEEHRGDDSFASAAAARAAALRLLSLLAALCFRLTAGEASSSRRAAVASGFARGRLLRTQGGGGAGVAHARERAAFGGSWTRTGCPVGFTVPRCDSLVRYQRTAGRVPLLVAHPVRPALVYSALL